MDEAEDLGEMTVTFPSLLEAFGSEWSMLFDSALHALAAFRSIVLGWNHTAMQADFTEPALKL